MTDIIERLRVQQDSYHNDGELLKEAVDEIEQLRHDLDFRIEVTKAQSDEIERLRVWFEAWFSSNTSVCSTCGTEPKEGGCSVVGCPERKGL